MKHPDFEVVGEAQIRRLDGKLLEAGDEPEFALKRYSGGRFVNVFPDVVAIGPDGQKFVLEFEHSVKDKKRLVSLMRAYLSSEKVAAVKYYAVPHVMPRLQAALDAISSENGVSSAASRKFRFRSSRWSRKGCCHESERTAK